MDTVIKIENLSKQYRLGQVGTGTLSHDLNRWWHRIRGLDDPYARVGEVNDRSMKGASEYVWALRDINFDVKRGESIGIIGKNGAGKSTILKIISRITSPTSGCVKIKGRIASLLEVGTGFHPELTGRENIYMNGTIMGMTRREITERLDEIVAFAGVERYLDTPVKRYSSGMTVRLGFAVAAHLEPEILVVDEVLAVGDAEFQKKAVGKLQDVSQGHGRTVLFVSHNMGIIGSLCTKCIYLNNGTVARIGSADKVIAQYLSNCIEKKNTQLSRRKDRIGNGSVRVTGINFFDAVTGKPVDMLITGQSIYIEISYLSDISRLSSIRNFNIGLAFSTSTGHTLSVLNSEMANRAFSNLPLRGSVFCHIPRLPFMKGEYQVRFTLQVNGQLADQVDGACTVTVLPGDFFNTGISYPHHKNGIYIEHSWTTKII